MRILLYGVGMFKDMYGQYPMPSCSS